MRTLVHLSDLRFGMLDPGLLEPLLENIKRLNPHLIAVAGDLTQRARPAQFISARRFLGRLPQPQVVVPGSHDVPLYDLRARFFEPLGRFTRFISRDLEPWFADDEIAVAGFNTARARSARRGARGRLDRVAERFCNLPRNVTRVLVARHPVDVACGADLLLAGHVRLPRHESTAECSPAGLVVQAGTANATRERCETHAFNFLRIERHLVHIDRYEWDLERGNFVLGRAEAYEHDDGTWKPRKAVKVMSATPPGA